MALPSRSTPFRIRSLALLALFAAHLIGCGSSTSVEGDSSNTVSSGGVATGDLEASISVVASSPDHVRVGASFERDSILFGVQDVELGGGDSVRVSLGGRSRTLQRDPDATSPYYETTFDLSPAEGPVTIRIRGSSFTLPLRPAFTVTSPTPGLSLGFQDHLDLEWTPADPGGVIQIWLSRSCKTLTGGTRGGSSYLQVLDDGAYSYDLGLLPEATDPAIDITQDCTLDLRFVREASASIAPPFSSFSQLGSTQMRTVGGMTISF
ncbi:MAG: hypothetical protein IPK00_10060 [Deltaproteobacteria bacterium]|nr:hypothetical protein [Deltaproteobacteria bacterium]